MRNTTPAVKSILRLEKMTPEEKSQKGRMLRHKAVGSASKLHQPELEGLQDR